MASDSQATGAISKQLHSQKVHIVSQGETQALLGLVGSDDKNRVVIDRFTKKLSNSGASFESLLSETIREVRQELKQGLSFNGDESFENYISGDPFDFLIASCPRMGEAILCSVKSCSVIPIPEGKIASTGSGGALAFYLLANAVVEEINCDIGVIVAADAINAAKNFDPFCGGQTQIGVVVPNYGMDHESGDVYETCESFAYLLTPQEIKEIDEIITSVDTESRGHRFNEWKRLVEQRSEKLRKKFDEEWFGSSSSSSNSKSSSSTSTVDDAGGI